MKPEPEKMAARPSRVRVAAGAGTSGLKITSLETWNGQQQNVSLFDPFTDELYLVMFYDQSPDLIAIPGLVIVGVWQIIEARTNHVVVHFSFQSNDPLLLPSVLWPWVPGTAHDAGLQWTEGADVFGFRAIIEAFQWIDGEGLKALDSFDVSDLRWFRLKLSAEL